MLDKHSIEILMFIQTNGKTTTEQIKNKFPALCNIQKNIDFLSKNEYIKGLTSKCVPLPGFHKIDDVRFQTIYRSPYEITPNGLAFIESFKNQKRQEQWDNFHKWTNTIIAALALLSAIPALILSIMQLMQE